MPSRTVERDMWKTDKGASLSSFAFHMTRRDDSEGVAFDTLALLVGRLVIAIVCRRFLNSILNPTLRELSADESLPTVTTPNPAPEYSDTEDDFSRNPSPVGSSLELPALALQRSEHVLQLHHSTTSLREHVKTGARALSRIAR